MTLRECSKAVITAADREGDMKLLFKSSVQKNGCDKTPVTAKTATNKKNLGKKDQGKKNKANALVLPNMNKKDKTKKAPVLPNVSKKDKINKNKANTPVLPNVNKTKQRKHLFYLM